MFLHAIAYCVWLKSQANIEHGLSFLLSKKDWCPIWARTCSQPALCQVAIQLLGIPLPVLWAKVGTTSALVANSWGQSNLYHVWHLHLVERQGYETTFVNSFKREATNRESMPWTLGIAGLSCPTSNALLSPIVRQEAAGCKRHQHESLGPLIKVSSRECKEHNSTVAAGFCEKYSITEEPKATVHENQSITGLQAERKGITNTQEDGIASTTYNITARIPFTKEPPELYMAR